MDETLVIPLEVEIDEEVDLDVEGYVDPRLNGNYEVLKNKPSINGVTLIDNKTSKDLGIDQTYIFYQESAASIWTIPHNLDKFPSVTIVDSGGTVCEGLITYPDRNTVICEFNGAFSGRAYLN